MADNVKNPKLFIDTIRDRGIISENIYEFILSLEQVKNNYNLNYGDICLLFRILPESKCVEYYNSIMKTKYVEILNSENTKDLMHIYKRLGGNNSNGNNASGSVLPVSLNTADKTLIITGGYADTDGVTKDVTMALSGSYRVIHAEGFKVAMEMLRFNYSGIETELLKSFNNSSKAKLILLDGVDSHATDIHIVCPFSMSSMGREYKVFLRIASELEPWDRFTLNERENEMIVAKLVGATEYGSTDKIRTPDGVEANIADVTGDGNWAGRLSAGSVLGGFKCVVRLHETKKTALSLEQLGFSDASIVKIKRAMLKDTGSTWVTGPIGSGKNTTINSGLLYRTENKTSNDGEYSNPVEVQLPIMFQRAFDSPEELLTLISKLKKQDVDLMFIGEIPDKKIALGYKEMVDSDIAGITTTHLSRAYLIPQKLSDYYGEEYINGLDAINAVITQVMFKKTCPDCRIEIDYPTVLEADYMGRLGVKRAWRANRHGCEKCGFRGYTRKVVPRIEILEFTDEVRTNILKYSTPIEMARYLKEYMTVNHIDIETDAKPLVEDGTIDISQIIKKGLCN